MAAHKRRPLHAQMRGRGQTAIRHPTLPPNSRNPGSMFTAKYKVCMSHTHIWPTPAPAAAETMAAVRRPGRSCSWTWMACSAATTRQGWRPRRVQNCKESPSPHVPQLCCPPTGGVTRHSVAASTVCTREESTALARPMDRVSRVRPKDPQLAVGARIGRPSWQHELGGDRRP